MSFPHLITFSGYAFCGKDTLANMLVEKNGFKKTYMSKPLEKALLLLDPFVETFHQTPIRYSEVHRRVGYDMSKQNPEVRRLLQILGTEIGREMFDEDCWLDLVADEAAQIVMAGDGAAVTGIRYQNELGRFKQAGAVTVWISRPGYDPVNSHTSDNSMVPEDCDIQLTNDETPEVLYGKLLAMLLWEGYELDG